MNVVQITIDTCRPQLFKFANPFANPHFANIIDDLFVQDGVVFSNSVGNASSTFPAHGAMFTGKLPQHSRINWGTAKYQDDTVFDIFHRAGHNVYMYGNGIEGVYSYLKDRKFIEGLHDPAQYTHGYLIRNKPLTRVKESLDKFAEHLDKIVYSKDFYLFAHFWDCHLPLVDDRYNVYVGYGGFKTRSLVWENRLHDFEEMQRAALVDVVCAKIQMIVDKLKQHGKFDDTLFVIANDHSESFFKKRAFHFNPCKDTINTFIVLYGPNVKRNRSIYRAQHIDVLPTILQLAGVTAKHEMDGHSLTTQFGCADFVPRDVFGVHFNAGRPTYLVTNHQGVDYLYSNTPNNVIRADQNAGEEDGMEENEELPERVKLRRMRQRLALREQASKVSFTEEITLFDDHECNNLLESAHWTKSNVKLISEMRSAVDELNDDFIPTPVSAAEEKEVERQLKALGYV